MQIENILNKHKEFWLKHYPLCIFCGHKVRNRGQLAHKIRRSADRNLSVMLFNTGLAHHECHEIFDNVPEEAVLLPLFWEVMYDISMIDSNYFYQLMINVYFDLLREKYKIEDPFKYMKGLKLDWRFVYFDFLSSAQSLI
jgi:hypothetical protein